MAVADCLNYLQPQYGNYAIPLDGELLQWMLHLNERQPTNSSNRIPKEFDERARYMVAELLENSHRLEVTCEACNRAVATNELHKQEWQDVFNSAGIRVGSSGYTLICPSGHSLISITTKVY
jgi:hypothetical protein